MARIHETDLCEELRRINAEAGMPVEIGKYTPGQYVLSMAYGGYQLQKVLTTDGAIEAITSGYGTRGELYRAMRWFHPTA